MERHGGVDYTLLWRQLATALERGNGAAGAGEAALLGDVLAVALYEPLSDAQADAWQDWLRRWLTAHREEAIAGGGGDGEAAVVAAAADQCARAMRLVSPKSIRRVWVLQAW